MCKGRQELELLGKHERGCLHGSHLIPAAAALWRRLPFIQVSCSLLGEFMVTKICLNCPSKSISPPPPRPEARGAAVVPSRTQGNGGTRSQPLGCSGDTLPIGIVAGPCGLYWGMRQMGIFSIWDHFWGIANSPSLGRNAAGLLVSPLAPVLRDMGMMLDPPALSPFSLPLELSFPFVPLDYKSQSTLLYE